MNEKKSIQPQLSVKKIFTDYGWEWMLLVIFILINIMNYSISPYYKVSKLLEATNTFIDKGFLALSMTFVICTGYIDISVASTVALSSVTMAVAYNAGLPMPLALVLCLLTGLLCGMFNGLILTKFKELAPMIVTLSTQIIFRGIALIILEDQAAGNFPDWFDFLGWGYIGKLPCMLFCFIILFLVYAFVMHMTSYGRQLYAIGKNRTTCVFSGINVDRIVFINYALNGLMAGVTSLFLTSRMGSTRPNVATSYEMDVIAMVVLGGVSTAGGKGRMGGVLISVFIIGLIRYGLGLININTQVLMLVIGALLIFAVGLPEVKDMAMRRHREKQVQQHAHSVNA